MICGCWLVSLRKMEDRFNVSEVHFLGRIMYLQPSTK